MTPERHEGKTLFHASIAPVLRVHCQRHRMEGGWARAATDLLIVISGEHLRVDVVRPHGERDGIARL
jgi:hypothetical protein